ncbi:MAG: hypothetical protein WD939_06710 [Dehalococcoidia bacterium]
MTDVHTVRPTDLAALVTFDGQVYPNVAVTRDRVGAEASAHALEAALEQWFSFATGRHTWISVKGATLRGLASARKRGAKSAWEIDCLVDAAEDDTSVLMSLFDQIAADAGRAGAEKIFLRTACDSAVASTAVQCGFVHYLDERLLAAEAQAPASGDSGAKLRRWTRADAYPTFRLYNRWTPETVRRIEAATFREWMAVRERLSQPRSTLQRVTEGRGGLAGWLRTAADGEAGRFDLMADPEAPELYDQLIDAALSRLTEQSAVFTLVPEFAVGLRERLEQRGFVEQAGYSVFARRTTKTVTVAKLATASPARVFPA